MKKWLKAIELIELNFCLITMAATTLLICATVFNRYIFHYEIMWLNDAALYVFVSFMFVAFAVCAYREGHISIDMFWKKAFRIRLRERPFTGFSWSLCPSRSWSSSFPPSIDSCCGPCSIRSTAR